jgi:Transmembrane domain of unknown function (DUF3566)
MAQTAEDPTEPVTAPQAPVEAPERTTSEPSAPAGAVERTPRPRIPRRPAVPGRRRTRVEIRHVGPLSVLKFSLLFYFCVMLIGFIALFLIFQVLEAAGTITTLETELLGCLFREGEQSTTGQCIPYEINGSVVFTWLFLLGVMSTVLIALLNTFIAVVYNLISDIVGGVEVTLAERGAQS